MQHPGQELEEEIFHCKSGDKICILGNGGDKSCTTARSVIQDSSTSWADISPAYMARTVLFLSKSWYKTCTLRKSVNKSYIDDKSVHESSIQGKCVDKSSSTARVGIRSAFLARSGIRSSFMERKGIRASSLANTG